MFRRARLYCLAVLERIEIALFTRKCSIGAASYKGPFVNLVFLECIDRNLTSYEVNKNLRKFWFATPFTKDGKSHEARQSEQEEIGESRRKDHS